jgi:hypothetical protein
MSWTTPGTAVNGTVIASAFWNTNAQADIAALGTIAWQLIDTIDLTSVQAFSSLTTNFKNLCIKGLYKDTDTVSTTDGLLIRFNTDTGAHYDTCGTDFDRTAAVTSVNANSFVASSALQLIEGASSIAGEANFFAPFEIWIFDYQDTVKYKSVIANISTLYPAGSVLYDYEIMSGWWRDTSAITSIQLVTANAFATGCKAYLYGG